VATGQSLLNIMEALSPELQLQSGETDVTKGLLILNAAQDIFETLIAQEPRCLGGAVGSVTTTNGQEYTTFPTGVLRIDGLDYVDPATNLPSYPLDAVGFRGGHRYRFPYWFSYVGSPVTSGAPTLYWTNGTRIYWDPIPDATYTVRYYGFASAADITAGGTFTYPDAVMFPLASLAVRIIRAGLDDPTGDISSLAKDTLNPVVDMLASFNRDGSSGRRYDYSHDT
jgi:hypothetical protein